VDVDGEQLFLARFTVKSLSALLDRAVADLNEEPGLTIALHARGDQVSVPPSLTTRLRVGDDFVALVSPQQLRKLVRYNRSLREVR
jgi:Trk K+ transport system NAD-binding subunit